MRTAVTIMAEGIPIPSPLSPPTRLAPTPVPASKLMFHAALAVAAKPAGARVKITIIDRLWIAPRLSPNTTAPMITHGQPDRTPAPTRATPAAAAREHAGTSRRVLNRSTRWRTRHRPSTMLRPINSSGTLASRKAIGKYAVSPPDATVPTKRHSAGDQIRAKVAGNVAVLLLSPAPGAETEAPTRPREPSYAT
jgi:hypothetical protein